VGGFRSSPGAAAARSDILLNQKINIRIHSDHKWPERVVFDTSRSRLAPQETADVETNAPPGEVLAGAENQAAENQAMDAFAQMTTSPARSCFPSPCSASQHAERGALPTETSRPVRRLLRSSIAAAPATSPSPFHKPPGRS